MSKKVQREIKSITVRPDKEITDAFNELCREVGIPPATYIRRFMENCTRENRLPIEHLPQDIVDRMRRAVTEHDRLKFILGE